MANIAHIEPGQVIPNDEEPAAGPPKQIEVTVTPQPKTRAQRRGNAKRTKKLVAELLDYIATGAPFNLACAAVNIHPDTFYDWRRADPSFARQVDQAVAKGTIGRLKEIEKQGKDGAWQALSWLIERRHPAEFAKPEVALNIGVGNAVNAPLAGVTDPDTGLTFPNLNDPPFGGELFQTNLIMPEPCRFISKRLPVCSIIRPTRTKNAGAVAAANFLTNMRLFEGQSNKFFSTLMDLAVAADSARRQAEDEEEFFDEFLERFFEKD